MPKDMRKDLVMYTKPADTRSSTRMRFQLILIFMNTKVAKSYGVLTKSAKNMQLKKIGCLPTTDFQNKLLKN